MPARPRSGWATITLPWLAVTPPSPGIRRRSGLLDNPRVSLTVLPLRAITGLDPVTLGDIANYDGEFIPQTVREQWLRQISGAGSQQGTGGGDLTIFAVQYGHFAAQLGGSLRAVSQLSPGAAELILFGNYGRAGSPRPLELSESQANAFAVSTFALSYGRPIGAQSAVAQTTIGVTLKYSLGHLVLHGEDRGTAFQEDASAHISFPVLRSSSGGFDGNGGGGFGIDVGAALVRGAWTFGVSLQNVVNTFEWDEAELVFRAGLGTFDTNTYETDFEEQPFANAPAHLRKFIDAARFEPVLAAGASYVMLPNLRLTGDLRTRLGDSTMELVPAAHVGVGAEYVPHDMLPLRAGIAYVSGGYQIAGGLGVNFGTGQSLGSHCAP